MDWYAIKINQSNQGYNNTYEDECLYKTKPAQALLYDSQLSVLNVMYLNSDLNEFLNPHTPDLGQLVWPFQTNLNIIATILQ